MGRRSIWYGVTVDTRSSMRETRTVGLASPREVQALFSSTLSTALSELNTCNVEATACRRYFICANPQQLDTSTEFRRCPCGALLQACPPDAMLRPWLDMSASVPSPRSNRLAPPAPLGHERNQHSFAMSSKLWSSIVLMYARMTKSWV